LEKVGVKKYYLAGPMTGYQEFNVPAFLQAKEELEKQGFDIELPADIENKEIDGDWSDFLAEDIKLICKKCVGIILLPEWIRSRGAKLEVACGLMQSLKYPDFEFRFYKDGNVSDPIQHERIAIAWHWDWNTYSKVASESKEIQVA